MTWGDYFDIVVIKSGCSCCVEMGDIMRVVFRKDD